MVFKFFLIALISSGVSLIGMELPEIQNKKTFFENQKVLDETVAKNVNKLYKNLNNKPCWRTQKECISNYSDKWEKDYVKRYSRIFDKFSKCAVFRLNSGENPYEALCDFFNKRKIIECTIALHLVHHLIFGQIIGEQLFNKIYASGFLLPSSNTLGIELIGHGIPTIPGHFGYITNIKQYSGLDPGGTARGENVFCVSNINGIPLYAGFGECFKNGSKTEKEILEYLYLKLREAPSVKKYIGQLGNQFAHEEFYSNWKKNREELQKQCLISRLSLEMLVCEIEPLIIFNRRYTSRLSKWTC